MEEEGLLLLVLVDGCERGWFGRGFGFGCFGGVVVYCGY